MRIVFAGTPEFAVPALRALAAAGHDIAAVYTQPDRPAGRGRRLAQSPVKQAAQQLGISVEQPQDLHGATAVNKLAIYSPDAMVVVAYGLILPPAVLHTPRLGCINVHASLLPRWRGAAPIQRAILAGDRLTGVSIMQMETGLDTGPVYLREQTKITAQDTGGSLHDRLAALGAARLVETLQTIAEGGAHAEAQNEAAATYAAKILKSEAQLDWKQPAVELERKVRAFNPWPVAQTHWRGNPLRIWMARTVDTPGKASAAPGTLIEAGSQGIVVACGAGALSLGTVQMPGGRPLGAAAFLNAHDLRDAIFG